MTRPAKHPREKFTTFIHFHNFPSNLSFSFLLLLYAAYTSGYVISIICDINNNRYQLYVLPVICNINDMRYALSGVAGGYQWGEVGKG